MHLTKDGILALLAKLEEHTDGIYLQSNSGTYVEESACCTRYVARWLREVVSDFDFGDGAEIGIPKILTT